MTVLVTGATGHVGRHLLRALIKRGDKVRVLTRYGPVEIEGVDVFYGDLLNIDSLRKAASGTDSIFHLAAAVDYLAPKNVIYQTNVIGTRNLLEATLGQKIIYLSSTAAMGKKLTEKPADENTPCRPSDFYGKTKLEAEALVREANGIVIRSADIVGQGFVEGYNYVLSHIAGKKMVIPGDGKNFIQWVHITDLIEALLLARESGKPGQVYIITGKEAKTLDECLMLLAKHLNVEAPGKHIPKSVAIMMANYKLLRARLAKQEPVAVREYVEKMTADRTFNISKATATLGFKPRMTYEECAKEIVTEYSRSLEPAWDISSHNASPTSRQ